jgi:hypothetical protein
MNIGGHNELTRDYFERRARRTTVVIAELRRLASEEQGQPGPSGRQLHSAIADFEAEVAAISAELRDLGAGTPRAASSRAGRRALG